MLANVYVIYQRRAFGLNGGYSILMADGIMRSAYIGVDIIHMNTQNGGFCYAGGFCFHAFSDNVLVVLLIVEVYFLFTYF